MNKEQIGLRIKLERTKQNLTQEQLAEMADCNLTEYMTKRTF